MAASSVPMAIRWPTTGLPTTERTCYCEVVQFRERTTTNSSSTVGEPSWWVSSREESHLPARAEPGVNLAAHPAPIVQPPEVCLPALSTHLH